MDTRFLQYYNRELQHVREMGAEFAKAYPKIAGRLGIENLEVADPYVERLLESFAFLSARVQLKMDAQYPQFTRHLFEMLYPHYLAPLPSMAVVEFQPQLSDPGLVEGFVVPRNTRLTSNVAKDQSTACEYRTAHEVTLWPIELSEVQYFATASSLANLHLKNYGKATAALRFRLRCTAGAFQDLSLDTLPVYFRGSGDLPKTLYEQVLGSCCGLIVKEKGGADARQSKLAAECVRSYGFDQDQALLPYVDRSFDGYRLVQEYFAFPERFLFAELAGLSSFCSQSSGTELDIIVLLDRSLGWLEDSTDASYFSLFCSPVVNLFPKRADRIRVEANAFEHHVLADRTKPQDYEVHSITQVRGVGSNNETHQYFKPFYTARDPSQEEDEFSYYAISREPRSISSRQRRSGTRSSYVGSEVYLSIVDARQAPYSPDLKQLEVMTLCSNRDLPLHMTTGQGTTDFGLDEGGPVASIRCVAGPTAPKPPPVQTENSWRLLTQLSLNYVSLVQEDGAITLKQMLALYADENYSSHRKQLEGLRGAATRQIVRRVPQPGVITFARGIEISINCDEDMFEGTGAFLFASVLEQFFAKYVSLNSFTETVLTSENRGEIMRWPARLGLRHKL